jgi:fused signal recognition particle receptor
MFKFLKDKIKSFFKREEEKEKKEESKEETKKEETKEKEKIREGKEKEEETKKEQKSEKRVFSIFSKKISDEDIEELRNLLIENNVAVEVANSIVSKFKENIAKRSFSRLHFDEELREALRDAIKEVLISGDVIQTINSMQKKPVVVLFVGVNGVGKTTTIAKLAKLLKEQGKKVVLSASDTFRAAAIEQIKEHAKKLDVDLIFHNYGADPTAVAFDAVKHAKAVGADVVLIDTAGRSELNDALINELSKLKRVIKPDLTIFVGDSLSGNAIVHQARIFEEKIGIDGLILTKCDIDEKGGAILSASFVTKKPIFFLSIGQNYEDIVKFDAEKIANFIIQ